MEGGKSSETNSSWFLGTPKTFRALRVGKKVLAGLIVPAFLALIVCSEVYLEAKTSAILSVVPVHTTGSYSCAKYLRGNRTSGLTELQFYKPQSKYKDFSPKCREHCQGAWDCHYAMCRAMKAAIDANLSAYLVFTSGYTADNINQCYNSSNSTVNLISDTLENEKFAYINDTWKPMILLLIVPYAWILLYCGLRVVKWYLTRGETSTRKTHKPRIDRDDYFEKGRKPDIGISSTFLMLSLMLATRIPIMIQCGSRIYAAKSRHNNFLEEGNSVTTLN